MKNTSLSLIHANPHYKNKEIRGLQQIQCNVATARKMKKRKRNILYLRNCKRVPFGITLEHFFLLFDVKYDIKMEL